MFRQPAPPADTAAPKGAPMDWALLVVAGAYALLPFLRLAVTGSADQLDMGVATIVLVLVATSAAERRRRRPVAHAPRKEAP